MDWFKIAKQNYEAKYYSNLDVAKFVDMKKITPDEYKKITGGDYK